MTHRSSDLRGKREQALKLAEERWGHASLHIVYSPWSPATVHSPEASSVNHSDATPKQTSTSAAADIQSMLNSMQSLSVLLADIQRQALHSIAHIVRAGDALRLLLELESQD